MNKIELDFQVTFLCNQALDAAMSEISLSLSAVHTPVRTRHEDECKSVQDPLQDVAQPWTPIQTQHCENDVIVQLLMEGAQLLELLGQEDVEDFSLLVQRPASPIARALYDRLAEHAAVGMESSDIIRLQSEVPSVSRALHDVQELLKEGRNLMERVALQVLSLLSLRVQKYTY